MRSGDIYDAFKNGETQWMELIIYVLPKQEIKYEKIHLLIASKLSSYKF